MQQHKKTDKIIKGLNRRKVNWVKVRWAVETLESGGSTNRPGLNSLSNQSEKQSFAVSSEINGFQDLFYQVEIAVKGRGYRPMDSQDTSMLRYVYVTTTHLALIIF